MRRCRLGGANEPRLLGTGCRPRIRPSPTSSRTRHQLPLSPPSCRDPCALHVSGTVEPPAFAARPAPPVRAVFLRLIPTILTRHCRGPGGSGRAGIHNVISYSAAATTLNQVGPAETRSSQIMWSFLEEVGLGLLPQLNSSSSSGASVVSMLAAAHHTHAHTHTHSHTHTHAHAHAHACRSVGIIIFVIVDI